MTILVFNRGLHTELGIDKLWNDKVSAKPMDLTMSNKRTTQPYIQYECSWTLPGPRECTNLTDTPAVAVSWRFSHTA